MLLSKRLFSHPVIKSKIDDDYINSFFRLTFEFDESNKGNKIEFKEVQFICNNTIFRDLVNQNKIKVYVRLECSKTLFQKTFDISKDIIDIVIDKNDLEGKLTLSSFAVANENISNFYDDDFSKLYDDTVFQIEKYDILAFDDGFSLNIIHDIDSDIKVSSIFLVIPNKDNDETNIDYNYTAEKIVISLPQKTFSQYDRINKIPRYMNLFFSMFAIPVLANSLNELKKQNFEELDINFKWFISVLNRYKEIYNSDLEEDTFKTLNTYKFAQQVFDNAVIEAIDEMFNEGTIDEDGDEYDLY